MSQPSPETAVRTNVFVRALIYATLIVFAVYYLLPLYVMLVNSAKPLDEIRQGNMMSLPQLFTLDSWRSAWSSSMPSHSWSVRVIASTASGPLAQITSAISRAFASAWPSGTTWPTRPIAFASGARRCLPVSRISAACVYGI